MRVKQRHGSTGFKGRFGPSNGLYRNSHHLSVRRFKEQFLAVAALARRLAARERNGPLGLAGRKRPHLRWVDGSYLLFVEPRLIGNLDVVSVRVADVCREVVGTPFGPKARFLV